MEARNSLTEPSTLLKIFLDGWQIYDSIEASTLETNCAEYQQKVVNAMENFEVSTCIVNEIALFSVNETIEEVSTESLQYILLPFFLGKLILKRKGQDRADILRIAEIYFKDFIHRCHDYELCQMPKSLENKSESPVKESNNPSTSSTSSDDTIRQLLVAGKLRNNKIIQYKRKKELDEFISKMKNSVRDLNIDDEIKRNFFLKFIEKSIIDSLEELESIDIEKKIVDMRNSQISEFGTTHLDGIESSELRHNSNHLHNHHSKKNMKEIASNSQTSLKPFIITRDVAQRSIFGIGYPSVPVMTVNDFYEQRVRDGIFPDKDKIAEMNRAEAITAMQDPNEKEEIQKVTIEQQLQDDDPQYLERMRRLDEYKDVVRRGDGNRHNRS